MQSYYISCVQQDRPQGSQQAYQKTSGSGRRCASQSLRETFRRKSSENAASTSAAVAYRAESETPSLGHTSSPSQDSSPSTPGSTSSYSSSLADSQSARGSKADSRRARRVLANASGTIEGIDANTQQKLCRLQENVSYLQQVQQKVISETAIRSRMARRHHVAEIDASYRPQDLPSAKSAVNTLPNSRCNARRRPCAEPASAAPPKLKRDTDCTDAIVKLIVCFSTKLVHTIWSQSAATPRSATAFNGASVLPLRVFIQETLRRSKTSYSTLQVALFYLILLKPHVGMHLVSNESGASTTCRALQCGRRMFLTALILASKYLQDRNYSSRAWSKISGLPIAEINENERRYLGLIQFNLHIKKDTFENWSKIVLTLCKVGEASMNKDIAQGGQALHSFELSEKNTHVESDNTQLGSDQWWSHQLRRLSAELVEDSQNTEEFLASLTSTGSEVEQGSESLHATLNMPPSPPNSVDDEVAQQYTAANSSKTKPDVDFPMSPASVASSGSSGSATSVANVPSRPNLPNLPTPQSTPRYHHVLPLPKGISPLSSRCRASSRALLGLDRQAVAVANLDMCPPPKPRSCYATRALLEIGVSACVAPGASTTVSSMSTSPESMISDVSSYTSRSRSSSLSSTSSAWWSSGSHALTEENTRVLSLRKENLMVTATERQVSAITVPPSYGFYHSGFPSVVSSEDNGVVGTCTKSVQLPFTHGNLMKFQDGGFGGAEHGSVDTEKNIAEQEVASVLAGWTSQEEIRTWPYPAVVPMTASPASNPGQPAHATRKQKRGRSSTSDEFLHKNVRHLLLTDKPEISIVESPFDVLHQEQEKQTQNPAKGWASYKKPIFNTMCTKRFALEQCGPAHIHASTTAAGFLRDTSLAR